MDFSKAFDKVDHQRLILKLKRMGINNKTSNWIGAWLSHRFQRVVVDGHTSNSCPVLSGIPQGSVLGPCLFLIYINDMPDTLKNNVRLFADDTIVYPINVREYRSCNKQWTIQRNWQHRVHKKKKNTTQYVSCTTMRKQTQRINMIPPTNNGR